jgi:hypothetical protein
MDIVCPTQAFINGQFCDSESGQVRVYRFDKTKLKSIFD